MKRVEKGIICGLSALAYKQAITNWSLKQELAESKLVVKSLQNQPVVINNTTNISNTDFYLFSSSEEQVLLDLLDYLTLSGNSVTSKVIIPIFLLLLVNFLASTFLIKTKTYFKSSIVISLINYSLLHRRVHVFLLVTLLSVSVCFDILLELIY